MLKNHLKNDISSNLDVNIMSAMSFDGSHGLQLQGQESECSRRYISNWERRKGET